MRVLAADVDALQPFAESLDNLKSVFLTSTETTNESGLADVEAELAFIGPLTDSVRAASEARDAASAAVAATRDLAYDAKNFAARRSLAEQQTREVAADLELASAQEALMHALEARTAPKVAVPYLSSQTSQGPERKKPESRSDASELPNPVPSTAVPAPVQLALGKGGPHSESVLPAMPAVVGGTNADSSLPLSFPETRLAETQRSALEPALPPTTAISETPTETKVITSVSVAEAAGAEKSSTGIYAVATAGQTPEPRVADAVWRALWRQEGATAYQIVRLTTQLREAPPLSEPLARALTLSPLLLHPDGAVAQELREALSEIDPDAFPGGNPAAEAQHLLLLAALLRPLLLAPDSTVPALAERLHLPDGFSELYKLFENFSAAAARVRHLRLDARAFAAIRDEGAWQRQMSALQEDVRVWRGRAPHLTVKFHAGTVIWRQWQESGGEIDQLLGPVQKNDPSGMQTVRVQYNKLTDSEQLKAAIDVSDRKLKRRGDEIHGSALEQLELRVAEATELAGRWLALMGARPTNQGGQTRHLEAVRNAIAGRREAAVTQLQAREASADPVVAASARVALLALESTWRLFDATAETEPAEPDVALVLNTPLLALPEVTLTYDWVIKTDLRDAREALLQTADSLPPLAKALDARLLSGDIVGATRLAEALSVEDPAGGAAARARLQPAARDFWHGVTQELAKLTEAIESSVVYGLINETERDQFDTRLQALASQVQDLAHAHVIQEDAAALKTELETLRNRRRDELTAALSALRATADPGDYIIVEHALAAGDLPSADEYISRLGAGERIASTAHRLRDAFSELYSTGVATDIEKFLVDHGRSPSQWREAVERASGIGELSYADVAETLRTDAARMISLWLELKRESSGAPKPSDKRLRTLQALLQLFGFIDVRVPRPKSATTDLFEAEFETETIADRSMCAIPYFGSAAQGRYRAVFFPDRTSADQIVTRVGTTVNSRPPIVFFFGRLTERLRKELAAESRAKHRSFLVIDEVLLTFLTAECGSRLPAFFSAALPLAWSDPYVTTASVMPPELFFGRQAELRLLLDPMQSCFVYGGRQLGKTALLKASERSFHAPDHGRYAAYIDLKANHVALTSDLDHTQIWRPIYRKLAEIDLLPDSIQEPKATGKGKIDNFIDAVESLFQEKPHLKLLLLLDEADRFLEGDARIKYVDTVRLKRLMESTGRRIKIVLAGLHDVLRTAEQANHPLAHFGEPIEVGPLISQSEWREAQQLVRGPLAASGFTFEREGMVDRILAQTNFYPSLIQLYCSKLMTRMMEEGRFASMPRYIIRESKLDETYLARDLRDEIRNKFRLTLQLDERYSVIAHAIAYRSYHQRSSRAGSFTVQDLATMARSWWADGFARTTDHGFRVILGEMVGLGVLRKHDDGSFTLRNQNLLLLMGTEEEVGDVLSRDRDLPEESAANEFHPLLEGTGAVAGCHPLSLTQIGALASRGHGVVLIGGVPAAGIDEVHDALLRASGDAGVRRVPLYSDEHEFAKGLADLSGKVGEGPHIALVPTDAAWTRRWIERAVEVLKQLSSRARSFKIVFVVNPSYARQPEIATLSERNGVVWQTLAPWSDGFVRHWLEDAGQANGPSERDRLRRRTGFWPTLLSPIKLTTPLSRFTGGEPNVEKLVLALADYAVEDQVASLNSADLSALTDLPADGTTEVTRLCERVGLFVPAERDTYRLEGGLLHLLTSGAVTRD
jgi:hypothetical protein